jgi:hypothetical protein
MNNRTYHVPPMGNGSTGTPAQRLARGIDGRTDAEALPALVDPDRVTALVGVDDDGTRRLLDDVAATEAPRAEDVLPSRGHWPRFRAWHRSLPEVAQALVTTLLLLPVAVPLMVVAMTIDASNAYAATSIAKGPGLELLVKGKREFVGPYRIGGKLLYCTDEGLQIGNGKVVKGGGAPKLDAETRARVNLLVNTYGNVTDNRAGARVKLAVATLVAPFDAKMRANLPGMLTQMTPADRTEITRMVTTSATHAPYRISRSLTAAVPGQRGAAVVTVLGSNGKPAAGRTVTFHLTGATAATATTKTDAKGRAAATYVATGLSQSMTADVTSPSSTAVWQNTPTKGHQLMVGGGFTDTFRASAAAELCPVTLRVVKFCDCDKDGARKVELTFTAESYPGAYTVNVLVNGQSAGSAALKAGTQVTLPITVRKGDTVEATYSINGTTYRDTLDAWAQA